MTDLQTGSKCPENNRHSARCGRVPVLFTRCSASYCQDLQAKCWYSALQTTVDPARLSLGSCNKARRMQGFNRLSSPQSPRFRQTMTTIANRQLAFQALYLVFIKQEHISITLCDVSNSLDSLPFQAFSSPEPALLLVSTQRNAASISCGQPLFLYLAVFTEKAQFSHVSKVSVKNVLKTFKSPKIFNSDKFLSYISFTDSGTSACITNLWSSKVMGFHFHQRPLIMWL